MVAKFNKYRLKERRLYRILRWGLQFLFVCLGFLLLSGLCFGVYRTLLTSPVLQVTSINVSGLKRLDPQTVIQQARIPSGINILSLDLDSVSRRLTNHPWIVSALINREIPDRIRIEIEERKPVALVKGQHFYLIDSRGICFTRAVPGEYGGLPIITGLDPKSLGPGHNLPRKFTALFQDLYKECQLKLPWRLISEIRWDSHAGLSIFTVQGGIQVDLGNGNYGPRIDRLKKVLGYLEKKGVHTKLRGIDLSHGNRVFVRGNFPVFQRDHRKQRGV